MDTNQIRTQLMAEHAGLRSLIEETRSAIARRLTHEPVDSRGLAACIGRLASALQAHNEHEERLLKGFLATVDAWGPARAEIMNERHAAEHKELHAELADSSLEPERAAALLGRLLEHMEYEEQAFLNEDVLREDSIVINAFGG
jgi:hypothetical protein